MKELQIFENNDFGKIRTIEMNDTPYFVGKDVADILGYANSKDALASHVDSEDKEIIQRSENATFEIPNRGLTVINESGLYSLILSSKLPNAKKFKRWVTSEVLPTIRKHGMYAKDELLDNPEFLLSVVQELRDERNLRYRLQEKIETDIPKVLFADAVTASQTSILVGALAKLIKQNGYDIGQKRLFEWLRNKGYLIKQKGSDWNMPTQRSMEQGLFEIKESTHLNGDGVNVTTKTPKVTGKGQQYFINLFLQKKDNLNIVS